MPSIRNMLNMLDPMMFPKTISWVIRPSAPSLGTDPEMILTTSSGADVPIATTVRPMAISDTLNLLAKELAPLTRKSAPLIRSTNPTITSIILINTDKAVPG